MATCICGRAIRPKRPDHRPRITAARVIAVLQEVRARLTGHQEDDPRPKLSNEHRSGMDAIGRLDERVPPDENGRVVIREAHLIDPETGDEWPFNADAWKERDRQRRNAVLDEIEQRVRAAEATITQHSWDEPPTIVWDAIKREDILAIIEDMRRGG